MPTLLRDVLQELNWEGGARIPISNEENKFLEDLLDDRTKELERLKEEAREQDVKEKDLSFHRKTIQYEHQENMQLIDVQRVQLENEENFSQLCLTEISKFHQDVASAEKQSVDINKRVDATHGEIARVLRRIEFLRNSLGGERGSLNEWRAALQRSEADVNTIVAFNKEDKNEIHELEIKRQALKKETAKKNANLLQICSDLDAEENKAERISDQVLEALNRRQQIISTWTGAVENLRQRDKEIKQLKNEIQEMKYYKENRSDFAKEKLDFLNTHLNNNAEIEREYIECNNNLIKSNKQLKNLQDSVKSLESQSTFAKNELMGLLNELNEVRSNNKQVNKNLINKDEVNCNLKQQITKYKDKLAEMVDDSKSSVQRMKQLKDMFENEEKYLSQLVKENERISYATIQCQNHLDSLKNEEKLKMIEIQAYKAAIYNIHGKVNQFEKELMRNSEKLYSISYDCNLASVRLAKLEGHRTDDFDYEVFERRATQLEQTLKEKREITGLLQNQISKLEGELILLQKNIANKQTEYNMLQNTLQELKAHVEGAQREERNFRKNCRSTKIEESILQLKINHAQMCLQQISNKANDLARGHLDLNAAMQERIVEANERKSLIVVQKNVLLKERGAILAQIKAEQSKIEQFKNRYDINVCLLGKDEMGEAYSLAYFKIKHLQEKSELQEEGDRLDAEIRKGEQEIAALEATLKVVDAANRQFARSLDTMKPDDPEMIEFTSLCELYDNTRLVRSKVIIEARQESKRKDNLVADIAKCSANLEESQIVRDNLMDEYMLLQKDLKDQREKLARANELRKKSAVAVRRKIKNLEMCKMHEKDFRTKAMTEANRSAGTHLRTIESPLVEKRLQDEGLNISNVYSAPAAFRMSLYSTKSSIASSRESITQRTNTESEYSIDESDSSMVKMPEHQRSDRSSDFSAKDSYSKEVLGEMKPHSHKYAGFKMPVSVIMLGENASMGNNEGRIHDPSTSKLRTKLSSTKLNKK